MKISMQYNTISFINKYIFQHWHFQNSICTGALLFNYRKYPTPTQILIKHFQKTTGFQLIFSDSQSKYLQPRGTDIKEIVHI